VVYVSPSSRHHLAGGKIHHRSPTVPLTVADLDKTEVSGFWNRAVRFLLFWTGASDSCLIRVATHRFCFICIIFRVQQTTRLGMYYLIRSSISMLQQQWRWESVECRSCCHCTADVAPPADTKFALATRPLGTYREPRAAHGCASATPKRTNSTPAADKAPWEARMHRQLASHGRIPALRQAVVGGGTHIEEGTKFITALLIFSKNVYRGEYKSL
jgi:hypothetical protein